MSFEYKDTLKNLLPEYLSILEVEGQTTNRQNNYYDCPICGSGTKEKGTPAFHITGQRWQCFACNSGGDIFDLVAAIEGLKKERFPRLYNRTVSRLRPFLSEEYSRDRNNDTELTYQTDRPAEDCEEYLQKCYENVGQTSYFTDRGLSDQTIGRFKLGYDTVKRVVTVPYNLDFKGYVQRSTWSDDKKYYKHGNDLFNKEALYFGENKYIFVVEGQIDALSIEEVGYDAVALGGVNEVTKLVDLLHERQCKKTLIIALDNDAAGKRATGKFLQEIADKEVNCKYMIDSRFYKNFKDANEYLVADREELARRCGVLVKRIQK